MSTRQVSFESKHHNRGSMVLEYLCILLKNPNSKIINDCGSSGQWFESIPKPKAKVAQWVEHSIIGFCIRVLTAIL